MNLEKGKEGEFLDFLVLLAAILYGCWGPDISTPAAMYTHDVARGEIERYSLVLAISYPFGHVGFLTSMLTIEILIELTQG